MTVGVSVRVSSGIEIVGIGVGVAVAVGAMVGVGVIVAVGDAVVTSGLAAGEEIALRPPTDERRSEPERTSEATGGES